MMDDELCGYDRAARALEHIRRAAGDLEPRVAVVLGSGLGSVADEVEDARILPAASMPGTHGSGLGTSPPANRAST